MHYLKRILLGFCTLLAEIFNTLVQLLLPSVYVSFCSLLDSLYTQTPYTSTPHALTLEL